jgi:hypothetical protein
MQQLRENWPLILFMFAVISAATKLRWDIVALQKEIKSHCQDLEKLAAAFTQHLTTDGIHFGALDRAMAKEWREEQAARSLRIEIRAERIETAMMELSREMRGRREG